MGTSSIHKRLLQRSAIESVIGHMKSDSRLARNLFKGTNGDAVNAILRACAHMRKIHNKPQLFCVQMGIKLYSRLATLYLQKADP